MTLVLSRKKDEVVRITVHPSASPQVIDVVVTSISPNSARLGFRAGKDVSIHRMEIQQRIDAAVPVSAEVPGAPTQPKPVQTWNKPRT